MFLFPQQKGGCGVGISTVCRCSSGADMSVKRDLSGPDDDVPAKVSHEWTARRMTFLGVLCLSTVTCITCSVMGDRTLPAILAFALMVISVWELQQKPSSVVESALDEEIGDFFTY